VVAVAAAAVQVPGLVSTERIRASEDALVAGDAPGARALAQDAVDAESWSASAWAQLANSERAGGDLAAAERAIDEAIEREPLNWRWPLVLSRIQAERGQRADAIQTFKRGRALAPWVPFYGPDSIYWLTVYGD
jgi:tetratricopeptide (TPR) repeat protein